MQSRAGFPTVSNELLRGYEDNTIDTGHIPAPVTSQTTNGPTLRGVEANTGLGTKSERPLVTGITHVEYGSGADRPEVVPFRVYGE
jgi:hypothetical protein